MSKGLLYFKSSSNYFICNFVFCYINIFMVSLKFKKFKQSLNVIAICRIRSRGRVRLRITDYDIISHPHYLHTQTHTLLLTADCQIGIY